MAKDDFNLDDPNDLSDLLGQGPHKKSSESNIDDFPENLAIIPVVNKPFMPHMAVPIHIEAGPYLDVLKEIAKMPDKFLGLVLTKDKEADIYDVGFKDLHNVGVLARVLKVIKLPEEAGAQVIVNIESRFLIKGPATKKKTKHLVAKVEYHPESVPDGMKDIVTAYASNLIKTIRELLTLNPIFKEELQIVLSHSEFAQPYKLCDFAVALTTASREELQDILSTFDLPERMEKALLLLKKELDISKLQAMINKKIESNVAHTQREFFLREQMKQIQKELGQGKDDKENDIDKFRERAENLKLSEEAEKVFEEELEKLSILDVQSAEYGVVRSYLDWLTVCPWGVLDKENEVLADAEAILDKDHYGLKDVKERISEIISVGHLKKTGTSASIVCLVGPPGVGKTSIGKSIARALNRKFYRLSVGGMKDEAEIKGHRRTYVGAMPGKMIQALKATKTSNPVVMIDEIDKMSSSYHGDPASALLEVLDPEQNKDFLDHYLDVRFDLSNILFVVTANTLDTIPGPLLDRMEVIRISGYIEEEKMQIAKKYLIPKARKEIGLKATDVAIKSDALHFIISGYNRESGVRGFEKSINKVLRKVATEKVRAMESSAKGKKSEFKKKTITKKEVEEYLGKPIFTSEKFYRDSKVNGVAQGLAWTSMGGAMLYIEAVKNRGKERFKLTGRAGETMNESSTIAYTYLRSEKDRFLPKGVNFEEEEIHIHIPDGATPKDGPSAGITITTAMISLMTGQSVPSDIAMTGEISLKGKVLPIGGLKEKVLAARRENIHNVICPKENERDYKELPEYLTKGINFYFVEDYKQVYDLCFVKKIGAKKPAKRRAPKRK